MAADEARMCVGRDQAYPGQAAGDKVREEGVPGGLRFAGGDLESEDFAVAVAVDAGRHEAHGVDDTSALTDLHRQRVRGDERERASLVQWAVSEGGDGLVEVGGHARHLGLRQPIDAEGLHQLVHPPGLPHR